ncbi:MAG: proline dehydrogenase family protein [Gaiellaceae bacterium]
MIDLPIARLDLRPRRLLLRRLSRRLIGGRTLEDACAVAARLNAGGKRVSLGLLGEDVESEREARQIASGERRALEEIEAGGLDAALSVKLSALGLAVDEELCFALLLALVTAAGEKGSSVLIDMERADATDATLRLYRRLREQGHDNVGLALQARLQRTLDDIQGLAELSPRISVCKGGYEESAGAVARPGKVRERFLRAVSRLADFASAIGISTHDRDLIEESRRLLLVAGRTQADYEFQTLFGVDRRLENELVRAGEPLRVYLPYGEDWYPYTLRRLGR